MEGCFGPTEMGCFSPISVGHFGPILGVSCLGHIYLFILETQLRNSTRQYKLHLSFTLGNNNSLITAFFGKLHLFQIRYNL